MYIFFSFFALLDLQYNRWERDFCAKVVQRWARRDMSLRPSRADLCGRTGETMRSTRKLMPILVVSMRCFAVESGHQVSPFEMMPTWVAVLFRAGSLQARPRARAVGSFVLKSYSRQWRVWKGQKLPRRVSRRRVRLELQVAVRWARTDRELKRMCLHLHAKTASKCC